MTPSVCLGEICTFTGGGTPSRKISEYWNGDIPWATVKDFASDRVSQTMERISRAGLTNSATRIVPAGTVLLVTRVGLGKVAIAEIDLAINQDVKALFPSSGVVPEYLLWALKHVSPNLVARGTGATVKGVTLKDVKELEIPLPPLDEQRRIVGILNRAAKIERLRARARERLREFIPALFVRMFGDPVDNPMRWPKEDLGGVVEEFRYGTSGKCNAEKRSGELPVLRIPNVVGGAVNWDGLKFRRFDGREAESLRLRSGDILFVRTNGNPNYIGRCAVFDGSRAAAFASYLIRARLTGGNARPEYVTGALALPSMRRVLLSLARTTAGNYNISIRSLASLVVPLPPLESQLQYERLVDQGRELLLRGEVAASGAATLTSSVMAELLAPA